MRIEPDPWLKSIFCHDVYRIVDFGQDNASELNDLHAAIHGCDEGFFFVKVPVAETAMLKRFLDAGFRIADISVTLDREPGNVEEICKKPRLSGCTVRTAYPEECKKVGEIAEICFTKSRFHQDPDIPKEIADTIKRKWVENYFNGERGESILVADYDNKPVGFLAIAKTENPNQVIRIIDLIGIHPMYHGRGFGSCLVNHFIADSIKKCDLLRVGTQIINVPSLHLYEKTGFRTSGASVVLHAHVLKGKMKL